MQTNRTIFKWSRYPARTVGIFLGFGATEIMIRVRTFLIFGKMVSDKVNPPQFETRLQHESVVRSASRRRRAKACHDKYLDVFNCSGGF